MNLKINTPIFGDRKPFYLEILSLTPNQLAAVC